MPTRSRARALTILLGLLVLLALSDLPTRQHIPVVNAQALGYDHRIIVGLAGSSANCNTWNQNGSLFERQHYVRYCWHNDVAGTSALDLNLNPNATAGASVSHQEYAVSGTTHAKVTALSGTSCTGVSADLSDHDSGAYLGSETYYHISPYSGVVGAEFDISPGGWTAFALGTVQQYQPGGCTYTGPHLHQGGDIPQRLFSDKLVHYRPDRCSAVRG